MSDHDTEEHERYIVEFVSAGKSVKVTAIDPITAREVSMVGSPRVSRKELAELAVRKLEYVMRKED